MAKRGRPSTYKEMYVEDIYEYLETCKDEYEEYIKSESTGEKSQSYSRERKVKVNLPCRYKYRMYINNKYGMRVSKSTMQDWEKANPSFRVSLKDIDDAQLNRLNEKTLSGEYNSVYGKFLASANHGLSEKTESRTEGNITINVESATPRPYEDIK